eukprot:Sspe_Gene.30309::Locus_14965_Transcript_1_1_Confidence_1.000_Length_1305::g.30309::m.30309
MAISPVARVATAEDAETIAQAHLAAWREAYKGIIDAEYLESMTVERTRRAWDEKLAVSSGKTTVMLCSGDGTLLGYTTVGPPSRSTQKLGTFAAEIYTLYLTVDAPRRCGLGSQLFHHACVLAANHSPGPVSVWLLEANTPAAAFYEARGCTVARRGKWARFGARRYPYMAMYCVVNKDGVVVPGSYEPAAEDPCADVLSSSYVKWLDTCWEQQQRGDWCGIASLLAACRALRVPVGFESQKDMYRAARGRSKLNSGFSLEQLSHFASSRIGGLCVSAVHTRTVEDAVHHLTTALSNDAVVLVNLKGARGGGHWSPLAAVTNEGLCLVLDVYKPRGEHHCWYSAAQLGEKMATMNSWGLYRGLLVLRRS